MLLKRRHRLHQGIYFTMGPVFVSATLEPCAALWSTGDCCSPIQISISKRKHRLILRKAQLLPHHGLLMSNVKSTTNVRYVGQFIDTKHTLCKSAGKSYLSYGHQVVACIRCAKAKHQRQSHSRSE